MLRTHTCGELRSEHIGQTVTLCGWVQRTRDKGAILWIDLRDRYGLTQITLEEGVEAEEVRAAARHLGREFVLSVTGKVTERYSKNDKMLTGGIEIRPAKLEILNHAKLPPFLIEDDTDGGDDLRMKYRYLDLRRTPVRNNLMLRHKMAQAVRRYLDGQEFIEVETPVLIKSTPEGARDFVVPSRMNPGEFYALPQSPQTFKQLLMVSGFDRYFQIVKCFRDEDLRADRQPEFTQIDCEMAFVTQEDILDMFEGLVRYLFKEIKNLDFPTVPRMTYADAIRDYGNDKPDTRFEMKFTDLTETVRGQGFPVFDSAELVLGINATTCAAYTRKQLDELTDFVKRPQIGATGLIYARVEADGQVKSSVDKFYSQEELQKWSAAFNANPGDLLLLLAGTETKTRRAMSELRLEIGQRLGLRNKEDFSPLWVVDFPLLEYSEEENRYFAMHHPFTSPKPEDLALLDSPDTIGQVRANAYDLVINSVEVGGGSIRIHNRAVQARMFSLLGFSPEEAQDQFGFLLDALRFGAPPHGGIAVGMDRLAMLLSGAQSLRDVIPFPKTQKGTDQMTDAPNKVDPSQLKELHIRVVEPPT